MSGKEDADLSATVLQQIIHLILYKELQPGEAISQRSIAHRLGSVHSRWRLHSSSLRRTV